MLLFAALYPALAEDGLAEAELLAPPKLSAYHQAPIPADEAAGLYVALQGAPVFCRMEVRIKASGEIASAWAIDCPDALLPSAREGLWGWLFYPPEGGGVAREVTHPITLEYRAYSVAIPEPYTESYALVWAGPTAVPRWKVQMSEVLAAQRYLRSEGLSSVRCEAELSLKPSGALVRFTPTDCPAEIAESLEQLSRRWGFTIVGDIGDLYVFHLSVDFERG